MEVISKIINNKLYRAAVVGLICATLLINGSINYAWFAGGIAVREFLLAFKK